MLYYLTLVCIIIFIGIITYYNSIKEGLELGIIQKKEGKENKIIKIKNSFFGNLLMFKERNGFVYAYNQEDRIIYKCSETDKFSRTQTKWEPIIEVPSLNDYDIISKSQIIVVILTNSGIQFYQSDKDKKEYLDIFTDVIDTTFNQSFHLSGLGHTVDAHTLNDGKGVKSCNELAEIVNNKDTIDEDEDSDDFKGVSNQEKDKVEYYELNAEQCKDYASDIGYKFYFRDDVPNWPNGCLKRDNGGEVFYIDNYDGRTLTNGEISALSNICQTIETVPKLNDKISSTLIPKTFQITTFNFNLCVVVNVGSEIYLLVCDTIQKQLLSLKLTPLLTGMKVEYLSDVLKSSSELYIFGDNANNAAYIMEGKLNNIFKYNFTDPFNVEREYIITEETWKDTNTAIDYGMTKEILEETRVYGVWKNDKKLIIYGLFPNIFQDENNRVTLFQFRVGDDINVKLDFMIRFPSTLFGSSLKTIYEPLGSSNLYYKDKSDFILATNKVEKFISYYGEASSYNRITIGPTGAPDRSNPINNLIDYDQYNPAMNDIDKYLMNSDNVTGSKEYREGDYIYFVLKKPILLKGVAIRSLNDVRIRAFEIHVLRDGKAVNINGNGGEIQDNDDNYKILKNAKNIEAYGSISMNKQDEIQIFEIADGEKKSVYTPIVRLKILKLLKKNQETDIGDFVTKFQGMLYGLRMESLEDAQNEAAAIDESCSATLEDLKQQEEKSKAEAKLREDSINRTNNIINKLLLERNIDDATEICETYVNDIHSYLTDDANKNIITKQDRLNAVDLYKTAISKCKELIDNKHKYSKTNMNDSMRKIFKRREDAMKNIKEIENYIENINSKEYGASSYFQGYEKGYDILNEYMKSKIGMDYPDHKSKSPYNDINSKLDTITDQFKGLEIKRVEERQCQKSFKEKEHKINDYLKFTNMYNSLVKMFTDKINK